MYKPSFAGFVDVDLSDKKLSLRSLVSFFGIYFFHKNVLINSNFFFACVSLTTCFPFFLQIDHSVIESFGAGGKTCITSRVYPALAIYNEAHLFVFNNGTETITIDTLNAWSMDKPER